ncbi:erythromycin esterase family protein [Bacillus carboniphilus]|uniref:Erythromycin esterase family protein n=1 Tax=Bacillus carboniphilus TaxID=86663 RepID=A0ABY9JVE1_9BACI|nr:erythromycin esterase family protein [Bacillus carboniphilus]WLR43376.1 erythromycin esterase family protein [Bacillus carboniphilus]
MNRIKIAIILLALPLVLSSCKIEEKVDHNETANEIKSIDLQSSDYSDLHFVKEVLKDKRVVMLGESSHGVSEYSLIKSRLIKFLHEEMDYNVVAFESGLAEVGITNEKLDEVGPRTAMKNSLIPQWHTDNVLNLLNYIDELKNSEEPIHIAGFDMQVSEISIPHYIQIGSPLRTISNLQSLY